MTHDLLGKTFGRWTVIERAGSLRNMALWLCRCECGAEKKRTSTYLVGGRSGSCGCKRKKHGHASGGKLSLTYSSWINMISRITNPSYPSFKQYKARGIKVCKRWRKFENFLADMGERPGAAYSLDRWPDNNGDYKPGNCRWATKTEQANNRNTNIRLNFVGQDFTLAELARYTGVSKELLRARLIRKTKNNQRVWTVDEAVRTPPIVPHLRRSRGLPV